MTDEPEDGPEVGPEELHGLVERVPLGWTPVAYAGRTWGLTRADHAGGGTTTLYAEELGGADAVSANVWRTSGGDVLRPCEMPAQVVLDFLRGWTRE
ncbi:peptide methionine sulfoxide reductase [Microlunatus antarcticus]|uniref:Peptide-methionine (S)-S-oxide reductase n=1 Tax=Microlunatus antarcticus TaxID=53388 RepID=A0A7W5JY00_9ACTN|nr:peptide methionine sulfoxide reductase [Microlunatus antarcticus]MBB3328181.1 peptide-methionine (S)-S-oxide reductase [Microlunatus antarcticus]